jgi:hypothetical protein
MRRRLTLEEAQAGVLPERFSKAEWHAMHVAAGEQRRAMIRRVALVSAFDRVESSYTSDE